jgi:hypothetical protein
MSIVTPSLNQGRFLQEQSGQSSAISEPRIHRDGRWLTDGSVEILHRYAADLTYWTSGPDEDKRLRSMLWRLGGEIVPGRIHDDRYLPGALRVGERSSASEAVLIYGRTQVDAEGKPLVRRIPSQANLLYSHHPDSV